MINTLFLPELREMLATNNATELSEFCEALHPAGTADFMLGLTPDESWQVLQHATRGTRTQIFSFLELPLQIEIIVSQDRHQIADLLGDLSLDDRVDLLNKVEPEVSEQLLSMLPSDDRLETIRLQAFPEGTAGAVMTTEVAKLSETLSIRQALEELQKQSHEVETIYYLYIVDDADHLRGVVSARDLISSLAHPEKILKDIMEDDPITVDVNDDQEEVANKVADFDFLAIPVVDQQHRMMGIITHDDIIDVVREEATEDAHLSAGVAPLGTGYLQTSILQLCWNRGIWLAPLFVAAMLTAYAIKYFHDQLNATRWLMSFVPLVISSGGNSGNQSATLVITGMTTGDVRLSDWVTVIRRELLMGVLLGCMLALVCIPVAMIVEPETMSLDAMFVVPVTLVLVVVCGTMCGSFLPLLFKKLGQDPALMSNPFVAGIIDIVGIIIYVCVATSLLNKV